MLAAFNANASSAVAAEPKPQPEKKKAPPKSKAKPASSSQGAGSEDSTKPSTATVRLKLKVCVEPGRKAPAPHGAPAHALSVCCLCRCATCPRPFMRSLIHAQGNASGFTPATRPATTANLLAAASAPGAAPLDPASAPLGKRVKDVLDALLAHTGLKLTVAQVGAAALQHGLSACVCGGEGAPWVVTKRLICTRAGVSVVWERGATV